MTLPEDDEVEREFLADLARRHGLPDLSEETLTRALGFERFTEEWAEEWFARLRSGRPAEVTVTQEERSPLAMVRELLGAATTPKGGDR